MTLQLTTFDFKQLTHEYTGTKYTNTHEVIHDFAMHLLTLCRSVYECNE